MGDFAQGVLQLNDEGALQRIGQHQDEILQALRHCNQESAAFFTWSEERWREVRRQLGEDVKMVRELQGDLDFIFKRLKKMKQLLGQKEPEALTYAQSRVEQPLPDLQDP